MPRSDDRRTGRRALDLAEVLALGLEGNLPGQDPERPSLAAWCATAAGAAALTAAVATAAGHRALRALRRQ
ncbi:hypothetical protein ACFYOF_38630 [Streptomyces sp. NPDC007148]|uniref:hypothetical protein n=1 Tax=Streptomyces sp. NPDC007148 TaxID=3364775 RepID=UPI0036CA387D